MAFSPLGIFSVLLEVLRPYLWLLAVVILVDAVLLVLALRRGGRAAWRGSGRGALWLGIAVAVLALVALPYFTGATHASLNGWLDWFALVAGSIGIGVAAALLAWPSLQLLSGRRAH
ncbi:MAG: hypothetical protein PVI87_04540 [Gammaproteobacteria bacterium]|jgi:hypothetical protein